MSTLKNNIYALWDRYGEDAVSGVTQAGPHGVRLYWCAQHTERSPAVYQASLVFTIQGRKTGYFDGASFDYGPLKYLLVSLTTPFECITHASPEEPALGIIIDIDLAELHAMVSSLLQEDPELFANSTPSRSIEAVPLQEDMLEALIRLTSSLIKPIENKVLVPAQIREIIFRALLDKQGSALYQLTQQNTPSARIAKVIKFMRTQYAKNLTVQCLADCAGMSQTAFHRTFKSITGESPLQYLKKTRLCRARSLIIHDEFRVNQAAASVGYDSPSQFSREFKRFFGVTPANAADSGYSDIDVWRD